MTLADLRITTKDRPKKVLKCWDYVGIMLGFFLVKKLIKKDYFSLLATKIKLVISITYLLQIGKG